MREKVGITRNKKPNQKPYIVRWYGEINPKTGKRRHYSKAFARRVEAEQFAAEKTVEFSKDGQRDGPVEVTLKQFCEDWLETHKKNAGLRPESVKLYRITLNRLYDYFGRNMLLSKLSRKDAANFLAELKRSDGDKQLASWTKHRILRHCKTIFGCAVNWETIRQNPFEFEKLAKCEVTPWYYLSFEEYLKLLNAAPTPRWKAIYALGYTGGLRFGELFNLMWSDIDFDKGDVHIVNRPATATTPPFHIKNKKPRTVRLPSRKLNILTKLHNEASEGVPYVLLDEQRYKKVVAKWQNEKKEWGNRNMVNNVNRDIKQHLKKAGIKIPPGKSFSIHTLRKCAGKNWANELPTHVTQKLMGHSSVVTTLKHYTTVTDEDITKAAEKIDAKLVNAEKVYVSSTSESDLDKNNGSGQS